LLQGPEVLNLNIIYLNTVVTFEFEAMTETTVEATVFCNMTPYIARFERTLQSLDSKTDPNQITGQKQEKT
jgi:hypothetical protein